MVVQEVAVSGDIDPDTAPSLAASIADAIIQGDEDLLLDCSELTFIDTTGIRVLVAAEEILESEGRQMVMVSVPAAPRRVFELLTLTHLLASTATAR
jgi:anti-anti-sigma factor